MNLMHLGRRFFSSIRQRNMDATAEEWLVGLLSPTEQKLYRAQPLQDRLHSVDCAQAVRELGDEVAVASALHDVGKTGARLGTFGRVLATVVGAVAPASMLKSWQSSTGLRCAIGMYKDHDRLGAELLEEAGASALAVAWAREHHNDPSDWTLDSGAGQALLAADHL